MLQGIALARSNYLLSICIKLSPLSKFKNY